MPSDSQYLWSTEHSMMLKPPTTPTTLSVWISLWAKPAIWAGFVCSSYHLYWIGWPLMPPLSLTQLKYACAIVAPSVKSVPGCLVTIAPSLIGVPLAFTPGFFPHFVTSPAAGVADPPPLVAAAPPVEADVLLLLLLPQALSTTARPTARTTTSAAHVLPLFPINAPPSLDQISSRRDQTRRVDRQATGPGR